MNTALHVLIDKISPRHLILIIIIIFSRHKPRYEFLALTPKYRATNGNLAPNGGPAVVGMGGPGAPAPDLGPGGGGWYGDHESDIPVSLLPKHVLGLHAAGDMAFHKDFEAIHESAVHFNGSGLSVGNGNVFPDVVNGGGEDNGGRMHKVSEPFFAQSHITNPWHCTHGPFEG